MYISDRDEFAQFMALPAKASMLLNVSYGFKAKKNYFLAAMKCAAAAEIATIVYDSPLIDKYGLYYLKSEMHNLRFIIDKEIELLEMLMADYMFSGSRDQASS